MVQTGSDQTFQPILRGNFVIIIKVFHQFIVHCFILYLSQLLNMFKKSFFVKKSGAEPLFNEHTKFLHDTQQKPGYLISKQFQVLQNIIFSFSAETEILKHSVMSRHFGMPYLHTHTHTYTHTHTQTHTDSAARDHLKVARMRSFRYSNEAIIPTPLSPFPTYKTPVLHNTTHPAPFPPTAQNLIDVHINGEGRPL